MGDARAHIGQRGEDAVCEMLIKDGHIILERNWRYGHLEIDIISLSNNGIHFVEVKSRVAPMSAQPEDSIGYSKRKNLTNAANKYVSKCKNLSDDIEIWIDVASVIFDGNRIEITYIPAAIIPLFV